MSRSRSEMAPEEIRRREARIKQMSVAEAKAVLPGVERIAEAMPDDPRVPILLRRARFLHYVATEIERRGGGFIREGVPADYYHACPGYALDPKTTKEDILWMYDEAASRIEKRRADSKKNAPSGRHPERGDKRKGFEADGK